MFIAILRLLLFLSDALLKYSAFPIVVRGTLALAILHF